MKNSLFLFLALCISTSIFGQATGKVDYKHLGISFTIPDQWIGQEMSGMYLMGSNTIPGMILLIPHDKKNSLSTLRTLAQQGLEFDQGTSLQLKNSLEDLSSDAIGGEFTGIMEWNPVKAYLIGMTNPHGFGVSIIALTTPEVYNSNYKTYALQVYKSIIFKKPDTESITKGWKEYLENHLLTYMSSSNSSGYGDNSFAGSSTTRKISLCSSGYFQVGGSSSVIASGPGTSLYSSENEDGGGTWEIAASVDGDPLLRLNYTNDSTEEYILRIENDKLMLNGSRYFRTDSGDNVPVCD